MTDPTLLELTAEIVSAHVENNRVAVGDVAGMISSVYASLSGLTISQNASAPSTETHTPSVSIRSSIRPDSLTCLACGKVQKQLKRHLGNAHDLTPDQYRERYGLKSDYPMSAPNSSAARSQASIQRGFGRKAGTKVPTKDKVPAE